MTNEIRLFVEVVLFVAVMVGITGFTAYLAVMNRRRSPDAISELVASNDELARRVRSLEQDRTRDHAALLTLQSRLESQSSYNRELASYSRAQAAYSVMLADRLRALGQDVPPAPGPPPAPPADMQAPLPLAPLPAVESLPDTLAALFNNEELDDLILRVGGRPEDLIGATIGRRAASLVLWARRRGKLDKLVTVARQLRPDGGI